MKPISVLFDEVTSLAYDRVLKGRSRAVGSLIVCVFLLMYCLEIELSHSLNNSNATLWTKAILPSLGFGIVNGFLILQRLSNLWRSRVIPFRATVNALVIFGVSHLVYYAKNMHSKHASWGLSIFVLAYGVFFFLLVVNQSKGKDFCPTTVCVLASLNIAMGIHQDKISGAIVIVVACVLIYFKEYHLERVAAEKE